MADDWTPVSVADDTPAAAAPAAQQWIPAKVEDDVPQPMRHMGNKFDEADYQAWVAQNTQDGKFSTPGMQGQTVSVDPYGNGQEADLRAIFQHYAPRTNAPYQRQVDVQPSMLEEYQKPQSPTLTGKSVYAKQLPNAQLGTWDTDDDGNRVYRDPGYVPPSATKRVMDKAVDLATQGGKDVASRVTDPDFWSPTQALDNAESFGGEVIKGLGGSVNKLESSLDTTMAMPGGVPWMIDTARTLGTGQKHTEATDWMLEQAAGVEAQQSAFQTAKDAGLSDKIANAAGDTLGVVSQTIMGGEQAAYDRAASTLQNIVTTTGHAAKAMILPAYSDAVETGRAVYKKTGDMGAAVKAGTAQFITSIGQGVAPLSAEGNLATRAATGAAVAPVTGEAARQVMNQALPSDMQTEYQPEQSAIAAVTGGVLGAGGGHEAAGRPEYNETPAPSPDEMLKASRRGGPAPDASGGGAALGGPGPSDAGLYNSYHEAWSAADRGDYHIADPIVGRFKAAAEGARAAADANPDNADLEAAATRAEKMSDALDEKVNKTAQQRAQEQPSAPNRRAATEAKVNLIAHTAQDAGEIKVEASDDGHVVTVNDRRVATFQNESAAENAADDARQAVDDRRTDEAQRKKVGDMTPDEMKQELLTHPLTGIPNRRAYEESDKLPAQVSVDANSLKWINDEGGHAAGDHLLKAIATALHDETPDAYHFGGDEFVVQAKDHDTAEATMQRVKQRLAGATIEMENAAGHKITLNGIGISHGVSTDLGSADRALQVDKQRQESAGLRAARGEPPPGANITAPQTGLPGESGVSAEDQSGTRRVLGQAVEPPAEPTPKQAQAGNYRKPEVAYHGMPIAVENVEGQYRSGKGSNGKPWRNRMKGADYGYFKGTKANDGDGVDVFMGKKPDNGKAYVIDQLDEAGKRFDEHKVVVGVNSPDEAKGLYLRHYEKGWKGFGGVTELPVEDLKKWLKSDDHKGPISSESVPVEKVVRGSGPDARHDSILQFLARHPRGLDSEEAGRQGIDAADMRLPAAQVGIKRAFRKSGMSFDHAAETLHQAGYPVNDEKGNYNPNTLLDRISDELRGRAHYSTHNTSNLPEASDLQSWRHARSDEELGGMAVDELERLHAQLEAAAERAAIQGEGAREAEDLDRIPFARQEEFSLTAPGGKAGAQEARPKKGGEQQDLFGGDKVAIANELARVKAALDAKRHKGQESVETGRPDDLFSQANRQKDITEKPKKPTTFKEITETGQRDLATEADQAWSPLDPAELMHSSIPELREYIAESREGGHEAEAREGERMLAIHEEQARVEQAASDRMLANHPVTPYGKSLLERVAAVEKTLGIEKPKDIATDLIDTGEKIGGARKDKWAERGLNLSDLKDMSAGEAANLVKKSAIWKPDYEAMINDGTDVRAAALIKGIYDKLGAVPRENTPVGRENYVEAMQALRKIAQDVKTKEDAEDIQDKFLAAIGYDRSKPYYAAREGNPGYDKFWSIHKGRHGVLDVRYKQMSEADKLIAKGWPNIEPWQRRFNIRQDGTGAFHVMAKTSYKSLGSFPTKAEAEAHAKGLYEALPKGEKKPGPPPRPHLDTIKREGPAVRTGDAKPIDFIQDFGFRGLEFGNWAANDERQKLVNHAYDALHDLSRALNLPPKALSLNGKLGLALGARGGGYGLAHYEPGKLVINITKLNGAGSMAHEWGHALDHYMGEYGRPDAYTTGARGATGWMQDPTGRTLAHLRPEMQQAWHNVMDAIFRRDKTQAEHIRDQELSVEKREAVHRQQEERQRQAESRPEASQDKKFIRSNAKWLIDHQTVIERQKERLLEMRQAPDRPGTYGKVPTRYIQEAAEGGDYWRRPTEMFARAFESYVQDKLESKGEQSQYLVHSTRPGGDPYPGEDRPAINKALQGLVDALKTRQEGDKEVLFRSGEAPARGNMEPAKIEAAVHQFLNHFEVPPGGVRVARNMAELLEDPEIGPILQKAGADAANTDHRMAFVHPRTGKMYFVADQIHSLDHVASLVAHEYITHFGLRSAFGDARNTEYQAILDGVVKAMPADVRARGRREFGDTYNHMDPHQRRIAAEETLAYYGQRYAQGQSVPSRLRRWMDRIHALIRDWLRNVMGLPKKFDELFVKRTLTDLEAFLRRRKETTGGAADQEPAFAGQKDTFYSGLAKAVDAAKREKGTGAEWEATLRNMPGVKAEELQWTGLKDWLEGRGRVSKSEVAEYIAAHQVHIGEVSMGGNAWEKIVDQIRKFGFQVHEDDITGAPYVAHVDAGGVATEIADGDLPDHVRDLLARLREGGDAAPPKYPQHATPGGENYRELLLTLPHGEEMPSFEDWYHSKYTGSIGDMDQVPGMRQSFQRMYANESIAKAGPESFQAGHWEIPNVLAHVRFDDRQGPNGEKILHVHEVQSDWHQKGRKEGYKLDKRLPPTDEQVRRFFALQENAFTAKPEILEQYRQEMMQHADYKNNKGVPDAPFKTTWPELAIKRMLRMAAEGGYDKLSWDTGDTNAERYNMQRHVDRIDVRPGDKVGSYSVLGTKSGATVVEEDNLPEDGLVAYIGKDMAQKAIQAIETNLAAGLSDVTAGTRFKGDALRIGGAGMRGFYDNILPKTVNKLVKKWGSSVQPGTVLGADKSLEDIDSGAGNALSYQHEIPAHTVDITPAMRDSVMEGQPMFAKHDVDDRRSEPVRDDETLFGREGAGGKAYGLVRRAASSLVDNRLVGDIVKLINPKDVSALSKEAASRTSAFLGELAHQKQMAQEHLQQFSRAVNKLSPNDQLEMIHAIETGAKQPIAAMQPVADALRKMLDTWRDNVRALGDGHLENFIDNYFPHWWRDQKNAASVFASIQGRRTMTGPKTFLKKRTIPTTKQGIEYGLKPITTNPLVLTLLKIHEMQRFISGVTMMRAYKDAGLAKFVPSSKSIDDGWKEINDPIARVSSWSEAEGGFVQRGRYAMPEDAARIINNHLSKSLLADFAPAQIIRTASNILNSMQLGFSAFHLGFTTMDAMVSKNALAMERLVAGEPLRALAAFAEGVTPAGAVMNVARGMKLMNAYLNPSGATPEMRAIVHALAAGGGRVHMDRFYLANEGVSPFRGVGPRSLIEDMKMALTQPHGKVAAATKAIGSFPVEYAQELWNGLAEVAKIYPAWQVPFELLGRTTRASSAWIMEHVVPMQKLGVFADMAADSIRRNPNASPEEVSEAMQAAWRSVDNRMGEMVYDNLFWNRTYKDASHLSMRAVGWNWGDWRELGGSPFELMKNISDAIRDGKMPKLGHKTAYVMGLVMTQALLGAFLGYIYGQPPKTFKDYMFPRTGRFQSDGTPERVSLPSYVKDVYEYFMHPVDTVMHKANPWIGLVYDEVEDLDYFGNPIYNPNDDARQEWIDRLTYAGHAFRPFSWSGQKQLVGSQEPGLPGLGFKVSPYIGVTPAPGLVTKPEKMAEFEHYKKEKAWKDKLRYDLKKARESGDKAAVKDIQRQLNDLRPAEIKERNKYLHDKKQAQKAAAAGKTSALIDHVGPLIDSSSSRAEMAQKIHAAGYPALAGLIGSLPERLRPEVADAIDKEANA